ncbi:MAG: F0F1 ATP synthase subunit B [Leifsonia xyli]|nr:MAG: F0F1 ATP synthase subunit B [Leifsonia xyli]
MHTAFTLVAGATAASEESNSIVLPALPDLVWGTISFLIVLAVVIWKVLPSINKNLDARRDAIEGGIERASRAEAAAAAKKDEYEQALAEARTEAGRIREQARADGAVILAELKEQAQAEAARIVANAQTQIEAERAAALVSLRSEVGGLALDLASGVIGESLSEDKKAAAIVDRFLADLEADEKAKAGN